MGNFCERDQYDSHEPPLGVNLTNEDIELEKPHFNTFEPQVDTKVQQQPEFATEP